MKVKEREMESEFLWKSKELGMKRKEKIDKRDTFPHLSITYSPTHSLVIYFVHMMDSERWERWQGMEWIGNENLVKG